MQKTIGLRKPFPLSLADIMANKSLEVLANDALRESEERFRQLADNIRESFWIWDVPNERYIYLSPASESVYGKPLEVLRGLNIDSILEMIHPQDIAAVRETFKKQVNGEKTEAEFRLWRAGHLAWVSARGVPIKDAHGRICRVVGITTDITDRKLKQEALAEQAGLLDLSSDAIVVRRLDGTIAFWSRGAEDMYGWSADEAVGQICHELLHTVFPAPMATIREAFHSGDRWEGELIQTSKAGVELVTASRWALQRGQSGAPDKVLEIHTDITEQKRTQDALQKSEARFRTLAEASPNIVWTAMADGTVDYYNERWVQFSGMRREQGEGWGWSPIVHSEDEHRTMSAWKHSVATGDPYEIEHRIRRKDGVYRWYLSRGVPLRDIDGKVTKWIGTATDITDTKAVSEELKAARDAAEAANRSKSAFLANMSHEIRTPLGAIVGFSELLRDDKLESGERREFIDAIMRNSRELSRLIDDILDLSKVEAGKIEVERLEVYLPSFLGDVMTSLAPKAQEKRIDFTMEIDPKVPKCIVTDPTRLRQILFNIIGNAIKFTSAGTVGLRVKLDEGSLLSGRRLLAFAVNDSGRGIAPEERERLFLPFVQADTSTTRRYGGTGLGLVLSRMLARVLGGDVTLLASELHKGSSFVITIDPGQPSHQAVSVSSPSALERRGAKEPQLALQGVRVLVAEDAADNQFLIRRFLSRAGAEVDIVGNGEMAVKEALSHLFDVVLMDIQMPVLDGYGATDVLRKHGYRKPIIALTAHAMRDELERCLRAGCNDYLTKPVDRQRLVEMVSEYARGAASLNTDA